MEKLAENFLLHSWEVRFVQSFSIKSQTYKMSKKARKWDKHGHDIVIFSQAEGQTWCHTSAYYLSALVLLIKIKKKLCRNLLETLKNIKDHATQAIFRQIKLKHNESILFQSCLQYVWSILKKSGTTTENFSSFI